MNHTTIRWNHPKQGTLAPELGMIATSPSWRRFWLPWRWLAYPFVSRFEK